MSEVFWAAFGGGAAAGIFTLLAVIVGQWFQWFLDRPLLKIDTRVAYIYDKSGLLANPKEKQLMFHASNPHTKPVTVTSFGISFKRKINGIVVIPQPGYNFPYEITGGRSLDQWISVTKVTSYLREQNGKPSDLKEIWFQSVTGRVFRGSINARTLEDLNKEFTLQKNT